MPPQEKRQVKKDEEIRAMIIRLPKSLHRKLRLHAARTDQSMVQVAVNVLKEALKDEKE